LLIIYKIEIDIQKQVVETWRTRLKGIQFWRQSK